MNRVVMDHVAGQALTRGEAERPAIEGVGLNVDRQQCRRIEVRLNARWHAHSIGACLGLPTLLPLKYCVCAGAPWMPKSIEVVLFTGSHG